MAPKPSVRWCHRKWNLEEVYFMVLEDLSHFYKHPPSNAALVSFHNISPVLLCLNWNIIYLANTATAVLEVWPVWACFHGQQNVHSFNSLHFCIHSLFSVCTWWSINKYLFKQSIVVLIQCSKRILANINSLYESCRFCIFEPFTVSKEDPPANCANGSEHWQVGAFCHDLLQRRELVGSFWLPSYWVLVMCSCLCEAYLVTVFRRLFVWYLNMVTNFPTKPSLPKLLMILHHSWLQGLSFFCFI